MTQMSMTTRRSLEICNMKTSVLSEKRKGLSRTLLYLPITNSTWKETKAKAVP